MTDVASAVKISSVEPSLVSQQEFLQHMTAMQQHYREVDPTGIQPVSLYILPNHLTLAPPPPPMESPARSPDQPVKQNADPSMPNEAAKQNFARLVAMGTSEPTSQAMVGALQEQHQRTLDFVNTHRDAMEKAITASQTSTNTQTFMQQMEALKEQAKANHEARIDALFNNLTALGTAHPAARPVVLGAGNKVGSFVAGLANDAMGIANTVKSALSAGGAAIGKAADTVGKWASGAVQTVGHFFSSLF